MNNKKARAIRRAMRDAGSAAPKTVFHPFKFTNTFNEACVRYKVQYVQTGVKQLVKLAKKIYRVSGVLPRRPNGN